jgi:hypothetical protein
MLRPEAKASNQDGDSPWAHSLALPVLSPIAKELLDFQG